MKKQVKLLLTAAVLLVIVLIAFLGLRYIQQKEMEEAYSGGVGVSLNDVQKEDIVRIAYQGQGNALSFQLVDGVWHAEQDPNFPLVQEKISRMVYYLAGLTADKKLADQAEDLASFGLEPAQITIAAELRNGQVLTYYLGNALPDATGYYMMAEGNPALYRVPTLFHDAFSASLPELAAAQELPADVETANVADFSIQRGQEQLFFLQAPGGNSNIYTDQYRWQISQDGEHYRAAAAQAVTEVLKAITSLQYLEVISYQAEQEDLSQFGLDQPLQITMNYLPDTEDSAEEQTAVGPLSSMHLLLGGQDGNGNVYAKLADSQLIGVVDGSILSALSYGGMQDFLPLDVCRVGIDTVVGMDILVEGDQLYTVAINRSSDQQQADTYTLNGQSIDAQSFQAFYELLTTMEADDTTASGQKVTAAPMVSIEFHRNTETFQEMTLQFIPYDSNFYLVDFDSRRDLLANKRDVEALVAALQALS